MISRVIDLLQMLGNSRRTGAELAARQARSLEALVRHAAVQVPFYRRLYEAHEINAAAFTAADLQRLPLIDKQQLRAAGAETMARDAPARLVPISTSGSSGEPFVFRIDTRYDQWRKAQYLRSHLSAGRRLGDRVLRLSAFPQRRTPWFTRLGLLRERQCASGADPAEIAALWQQLAPDVLQGYPSSLRSLSHYCLERGIALRPAPRLILTDSEMLTADTRALLEEQLGAPVRDIFGTYETDNIGFQCGAGAGYHIATDCVVLEILRDGKPVPRGETGEIVVTVLANRTSPFIRYRLRDLGRLAVEPCPCGLPFPLLTDLQGRADDLIALGGGRERTYTEVLGRLYGFGHLMHHYQLRQTRIGCFELLIVPSSRFEPADAGRISAAVLSALGEAVLTLRRVDAIAPDRSGKRRSFIRESGAERA